MSLDNQPKVFVSEKVLAEVRARLQEHEHRLVTDQDYANRWYESELECLADIRRLTEIAEQRKRNGEISFGLRYTPTTI